MQATDSLGSSAETPASLYTYIGLSNYEPLSPFRILDTRSGSCVQCTGGALGPGAIRKLQITGVLGDRVPTGTTAVVLNVTAVADTASSLLTVFPDGTTRPNASNLNFAAGAVIPNLVTVTLGTDGAVDIYNALGTVNVLADVEGYFQPELSSVMAGEFHPIAPIRMCDTRTACGGNVALRAERPIVVNVTGTGGIPERRQRRGSRAQPHRGGGNRRDLPQRLPDERERGLHVHRNARTALFDAQPPRRGGRGESGDGATGSREPGWDMPPRCASTTPRARST